MKYVINYDECFTDETFEYNEDVKFISNNRDYNSQNTQYIIDDFENLGELKDYLGPEYEVHEVFAYIHSGIALSVCKGNYPFTCPWDSGFFGLIAFKKGEFGENNIGLAGFVENWGRAWNGEVYYYSIEDKDGEVLDSCGGFVGYEYCEEEAKSQLEYYQNEQNIAKMSKIKALIKYRVPLHLRLDLIQNVG